MLSGCSLFIHSANHKQFSSYSAMPLRCAMQLCPSICLYWGQTNRVVCLVCKIYSESNESVPFLWRQNTLRLSVGSALYRGLIGELYQWLLPLSWDPTVLLGSQCTAGLPLTLYRRAPAVLPGAHCTCQAPTVLLGSHCTPLSCPPTLLPSDSLALPLPAVNSLISWMMIGSLSWLFRVENQATIPLIIARRITVTVTVEIIIIRSFLLFRSRRHSCFIHGGSSISIDSMVSVKRRVSPHLAGIAPTMRMSSSHNSNCSNKPQA